MNISAIDPELVDDELNRTGYIVIKEAELAAQSSAARAEYDRCLQKSKLHAPREKFRSQHASIGALEKIGYRIGERTWQSIRSKSAIDLFYRHDKNYPALGVLIQIHDRGTQQVDASGRAFGANPERDGFWDACRVHHYPRGGGFMVVHKDTHFPA